MGNKKRSEWMYDENFREIARQVYPKNLRKAAQYGGKPNEQLSQQVWKSLGGFIGDVDVARMAIDDTVGKILESACEEAWVLFLIRVARWGNMIPGTRGASFKKIFACRVGEMPGKRRIKELENVIQKASKSLHSSGSPEGAWACLTQPPAGLSPVMASKALHFLARAAGWDDPVPVAIDNAMVRQRLWPEFKASVLARGLKWPRPGSLRGNSWEAYNRYMTAIRTWAELKGWTCMEIENALFKRYRDQVELAPNKQGRLYF